MIIADRQALQQSVFTAGTIATSGGAASFNKTVMDSDQNSLRS